MERAEAGRLAFAGMRSELDAILETAGGRVESGASCMHKNGETTARRRRRLVNNVRQHAAAFRAQQAILSVSHAGLKAMPGVILLIASHCHAARLETALQEATARRLSQGSSFALMRGQRCC